MRYFRISEVVMRFDLPISIPSLIMSLVNSIPPLNLSFTNRHYAQTLPNKTGEEVSMGHLAKDFSLLKREMRQRKYHVLNIVKSSYNAWNRYCHFAAMSGARLRINSLL